jgi:hypothetical protein
MISDYLTLQGVAVTHLIDVATALEHALHPCARRERQDLIYDLGATQSLFD